VTGYTYRCKQNQIVVGSKVHFGSNARVNTGRAKADSNDRQDAGNDEKRRPMVGIGRNVSSGSGHTARSQKIRLRYETGYLQEANGTAGRWKFSLGKLLYCDISPGNGRYYIA